MTARNGTAVKRAKGPGVDTPLRPRMSASQREMAELRKRFDKLEEQSNTTTWLLAQLIHEIRLAQVQQMLSTPEGQAAVAQQLVSGQLHG